MNEIYCSFCGLSNLDPEVKVMVRGPGVCICGECIMLAKELADEAITNLETEKTDD